MAKYIFTKDSKLYRPHNISNEAYISASYGEEFVYEPQDTPLRVYHFSGSSLEHQEYRLFNSLKNTINYYFSNDETFNYNNLINKPITLYAFSSYHLGSGFKKGSIELNTYLTGSILASASDYREDGILYQSGSDEKIGFVLYKEGFIGINNTSSLTSSTYQHSSSYQTFNDNPRWTNYFLSSSQEMYYDMAYDVVNNVSTVVNFVYANKNEYNHSNNETYIESGSYNPTSSSFYFIENNDIKVKKTNKSPFVSGSATFEKQTFITKIGMYDSDKKLIGIGSLANPVRKTENREYTFKLKFDI